MTISRVGIVYHPHNEAAHSLANELAQFLDSSGVTSWLSSAWEGEQLHRQMPGTDIVLTTGGDGTILRTAQAVINHGVPITGVNLGKLGFMAELSATKALAGLGEILQGKGWRDERTVLEAELISHADKGKAESVFYALNDVVVARGDIARVINIGVKINGKKMDTYKCDGVIVATATGSTGYSLSTGGPILAPQADDFLFSPILPHPNPAYHLVFQPETLVELEVNTYHQATMSIDGHINLPLATGDILKIKRSQKKVTFLRTGAKDYFYNTLKQKMKGNNDIA